MPTRAARHSLGDAPTLRVGRRLDNSFSCPVGGHELGAHRRLEQQLLCVLWSLDVVFLARGLTASLLLFQTAPVRFGANT